MSKIIKCKKVNWDDKKDEIFYYAIPRKLESSLVDGNFIYIIDEEKGLIIYEIKKVYGKNNNLNDIEIKTLRDSEEMYLVSDEYFVKINDKFIEKYTKYPLDVLEKEIKDILKEINWTMFEAGLSKVDDKRKKYLENIFGTDELVELKKNSKKMTNRWFWHFNKFELDLVCVINLYNTHNTILEVIERNKRIKNYDKMKLKAKLHNEFNKRESAIQLKGINRFNADQPIGISASQSGEEIIFGKSTRYEFSLNFYSIWNTFNRMLTVSYIPILILLLDNSRKLEIYILLGIVYFITLVLSDEKQVKNIVNFVSGLMENHDIAKNYLDLFVIGSVSVIQFIIISIQITYSETVISSYTNFIKYFTGDLLLSYLSFALIIMFVEVAIYIISCLTSTLFYLKKKSVLIAISKFIFKIAFWSFASYSLYDILNIKAIMALSSEFHISYIAFGLSLLFSVSFVISGYKGMKEALSDKTMTCKRNK